MRNIANHDIRVEVTASGLHLWQIADKLNINDGNFSRKLRKELSPEDKARIREIISELKVEADHESAG